MLLVIARAMLITDGDEMNQMTYAPVYVITRAMIRASALATLLLRYF